MNEDFGTASNYPAALASNYFVQVVNSGVTNVLSRDWWKGTGSPLDFTNPNAVQYLQNTLSNLVTQSGSVIGGFKTDDGEAQAVYSTGPFIPTNAVYADGRTVRRDAERLLRRVPEDRQRRARQQRHYLGAERFCRARRRIQLFGAETTNPISGTPTDCRGS